VTQPAGRIVEMAVNMNPTGFLKTVLDETKERVLAHGAVHPDRPRIGTGAIELRVAKAPPHMGMPQGWYCWGVVENYPSGHQEILIGGGKPTVVEASVEGSAALESLLNTRGGR
jgi:hypothetical protein